ncbi:hypothetical protein GCM10017674_80030 [Streptomyces gardneri]|uniref:Uncharacterized protein n=1 Tax=Streptomyces gardneri TaxID=66892 RepID=A0A4Y3RX27_9ACTN|nr:hypothetical protein SGA01_77170 [Streptomyces gardneri]GHH23444.1 hypothetical protein GCM10017674_80030 [Streptomyces gardneri]
MSEFGAGLIGALVGGAASIIGAWMQSRPANRASGETLAKASALSAYEALDGGQDLPNHGHIRGQS